MKQLYFILELFALILILTAAKVSSHGRLNDPPSRSTLWRFSEFSSYNPPKNYNDHELNCGGFYVQHGTQGGKCGECGDPFGDPKPRANEYGGRYGRGIIVRNYTAGSEISVFVELTANHKGYFEFRLCPNNSPSAPADQDCFDRYLLPFINGGGTKYVVQAGIRNFYMRVKLPDGIRCSNCVLQWHYRAGNNWGTCEDGRGAVGCGPQETFRSCADIAIF